MQQVLESSVNGNDVDIMHRAATAKHDAIKLKIMKYDFIASAKAI